MLFWTTETLCKYLTKNVRQNWSLTRIFTIQHCSAVAGWHLHWNPTRAAPRHQTSGEAWSSWLRQLGRNLKDNIIIIIIIVIIIIIIIISTRPKPAYSRPGLAGCSLRASGAQLGSGNCDFSWQTHRQKLHHNICIIIIIIVIIIVTPCPHHHRHLHHTGFSEIWGSACSSLFDEIK